MRMPRGRSIGVSAAVGVMALALSGCADLTDRPEVSSDASPVAEPVIRAWLHQERSDEVDRRARVRIVNDDTSSLEVAGIRVIDPRLAQPIERAASPLPPGRSVDLTVDLPEVTCDEAAVGPAVLELIGLDGSGRSVDLPDSLGFLTRLQERECRQRTVGEALGLSWEGFTPGGPGEDASIRLVAHRSSASVSVIAVQSTPLLEFGPGVVRAVVDTPPAGEQLDQVIPLMPQRCDPHVVQEDKRGTVFSVEVDVEGERGAIDLAVDAEARARILTWVAVRCGFGG